LYAATVLILLVISVAVNFFQDFPESSALPQQNPDGLWHISAKGWSRFSSSSFAMRLFDCRLFNARLAHYAAT
jgi:hypothetical protein